MKEELLRKLIDGAYSCACIHGFHDKDLSIRHLLMLVLTEVSEAVEADRKALHADFPSFHGAMSMNVAYATSYHATWSTYNYILSELRRYKNEGQ